MVAMPTTTPTVPVGFTRAGIATLPTIDSTTDPRADLDLWDSQIADLSLALHDAGVARADLDAAALSMERIEAGIVLSIEGRNETERRARLTLALAESPAYELARAAHVEARARLVDAERRVQVTRERCRLLRVSLTLDTYPDHA